MRAVFHAPWENAERWLDTLAAALPEVRFDQWPDCHAADHELAVVWKPPAALFRACRDLRLICSLGAGTDHILVHGPDLPRDARILRLVDPVMGERMAEYVAAAILGQAQHHRLYAAQQRSGQWRRHQPTDARATTVGLLGLGHLGGQVARTLCAIGFRVMAWTRRPRTVDGIEVLHGADALPRLLAQTDALVCLLPATERTRGLVDARLLAWLKRGAFFVNAARGELVVEADLLAALDDGQLSGAVLDAFETEPLPKTSPFWTHPKVAVTPHVASLSDPQSGARALAADIRRYLNGEAPIGAIDRDAGY